MTDKMYKFELLVVFEDDSEIWDCVVDSISEEEHQMLLRCARNAIARKQQQPERLIQNLENWSTPEMQKFKKGLEDFALWNFTGTTIEEEHDLEQAKLYFYLPEDIYDEVEETVE